MEVLEIVNLTKYYGKNLGVKNINLTINQNEIFGFIGPNGSGKSTTIRSIMNLINKTSGEVYINNQLFTKDVIDLKKQIGYVPSEINLYEDLTVNKMIQYSSSFYQNIDDEYLAFLIAKFQLDQNKKIEDLSLGNKKKLGIVLALMHKPKLLILDEPTSGLDPLMQEIFFELLLEQKHNGVTIFYSTHVLNEVKRICDRVGMIKNGELIKVDSVKNLSRNQLLIVTIKAKSKRFSTYFQDKIIEKSDNQIKFLYDGNINKLINLLSEDEIETLLIEEPSIEETFLSYYV